MKRFFVDTSAWFAYVNAGDPDHGSVQEVLDGFRGRIVTSNSVFDETITLCAHRLGHRVAVDVGQVLLDPGVVDLIHVTLIDEQKAWALFVDRSDKDYSFTDCTSFALMRRMGIQTAVSLDADFRREGFDLLP
ncbi:MAG: PIN domain-containing protein [Deltaproteobacteria bacterium]|nr:PIN domain-containing protein [Deltaproteobacteria bacterium]